MDPVITSALLSIASTWAWDVIGKDIISKSKALLQKQWYSIDWLQAAKVYAYEMHRQHSTMRILGRSEPVALASIFTDVHILDKVTAQLRYDIATLRHREIDRFERYLHANYQKRVSGLTLVGKGYNLFVLGKPGAGKTTFLKYITLQALNGTIAKTPIFISLKEWSTSREKRLLPFIIRQFEICGFPDSKRFVEELFKNGKALVLFDGLDEVNQENDQRYMLVQLIQDFAKRYRRNQLLITCRIAASEYAFENFVDVEVADFGRDQIHSYVAKWFGHNNQKYTTFINELYEEENEGVRELCSIPLLLSMLCLAFDETGSFPRRRAELYEDAVETLLRRWDAKRNIRRDEIYRDLSTKRKQQMLAHIAAPTFEKGEYFIERRVLEKYIANYLSKLPSMPNDNDIDGHTILRAIEAQHSLLVERAHDIYSFSHLTFQEYFTAQHIVENEARGTITDLVHNHLTDNRWQEVFLLTASLLDDGSAFAEAMRLELSQIIHADNDLYTLIEWAKQKSYTRNTIIQRNFARSAYVNLVLILGESYRQYYKPSAELASVFNIEDNIVEILDTCLDVVRDLRLLIEDLHKVAGEKPIESFSSLNFLRDLDSSLMRKFDSSFFVDFGITCAWQVATVFSITNHEDARKYFVLYKNFFVILLQVAGEQYPSSSLLAKLRKLVIPTASGSTRSWKTFSKRLLTILDQECKLVNVVTLSDEQRDNFDHFLNTTDLVIRCIDLAYVNDRNSLLSDLLWLSQGPRFWM